MSGKRKPDTNLFTGEALSSWRLLTMNSFLLTVKDLNRKELLSQLSGSLKKMTYSPFTQSTILLQTHLHSNQRNTMTQANKTGKQWL